MLLVICIDIPHPVPQQTATADVNSAYHVNENEWGYRFRPHLRTCRINGAGKTFLWSEAVWSCMLIKKVIHGQIQPFSDGGGGGKIWQKKQHFSVKLSRGLPPGKFFISKGFITQSKVYWARKPLNKVMIFFWGPPNPQPPWIRHCYCILQPISLLRLLTYIGVCRPARSVSTIHYWQIWHLLW